jgi:hypothetical protein
MHRPFTTAEPARQPLPGTMRDGSIRLRTGRVCEVAPGIARGKSPTTRDCGTIQVGGDRAPLGGGANDIIRSHMQSWTDGLSGWHERRKSHPKARTTTKRTTRFFQMLIATLMSACATTNGQAELVVQRAPFDLQCSEDRIQVYDLGNNAFGAKGCGRRATYVVNCSYWTIVSCTAILNTRGRPPDGDGER